MIGYWCLWKESDIVVESAVVKTYCVKDLKSSKMEILHVSVVFFEIFLTSFSEGTDCDFYCQDGPAIRSTDCYSVDGCDFAFRDISFSYKFDLYMYTLRLKLNVTEMSYTGNISDATFVHNGMLRSDMKYTINRYIFQVKYSHGDYPLYFYDFGYTILNLQPEDAGTYHVSLLRDYNNRLLVRHTYRLFVIYHPPSPLFCEMKNLTLFQNNSYDFELTCSIPDAYPVIDLDVSDPNECNFEKHYSRNGKVKMLNIYITSCGDNATVVCVATRGQLDFMPITSYYGSCAWEVPKTYPGKT